MSAVQNVKVQGADFVNNVTSNRLQIIGVAYQPGGSDAFGKGSDPLSNGTLCLRDAALMQSLGVNTIRVYNLDPTLNHDDCVSIFNAVGIYMLLDVNSPLPNQSLNPGDLDGSYSSTYLNHIFSVVEAFHNYPNLLGFFSGNEVMNDGKGFPDLLLHFDLLTASQWGMAGQSHRIFELSRATLPTTLRSTLPDSYQWDILRPM